GLSKPGAHRTDANPRRVGRLVRTLPLAWVMAIARDRELAAALAFEPNRGLLPQPGSQTLGVLTTEYPIDGAYVGRNGRIAQRKFDQTRMPALAAFLADGRRVSYRDLAEIVTASGIADAHAGIVRLLDAQAVRAVAPYSQHDAAPLETLARAVGAIHSRRASRSSTLVRGVHNMASACPRLSGPVRAARIETIRRTAVRVFQALASQTPAWLDRGNLVYEDVRFDGAPVALPPSVRDDLSTVARELAP